jgi:predicted RNase H-like HicB family nuclease
MPPHLVECEPCTWQCQEYSGLYAQVGDSGANSGKSTFPREVACNAGSTGSSIEETETLIREAIEFHLEGMRANNQAIPKPTSRVDYVEVAA